ncbi:iron uptake transporter deferrochelatase/peroxidase subunit [Tumebacillus flagellatus]|uniref:Deferrochelatase n=1 Tax=Tumebacillus flagellatus TaxID=1157490 RepID=A0A074LWD0_9BACL|nr:iron uptake transporter deferrochelatase/peroxidase subunit [Tumebacillus flagellatus]KEO84905.1 deferrochelatase [Tumebacillus flagellatus]
METKNDFQKEPQNNSQTEPKLSRRQLLKMAGVGGAGLLLGGAGVGSLFATGAVGAASSTATAQPAADILPFYGKYQQGIVTPQQDFFHFAAFDIIAKKRSDVRALFEKWTDAAARITQGQPVGDESNNQHLPPTDTGEAIGLTASKLTITFGVGPTLFTKDGADRFGLASKRPAPLADLPAFSADELQAEWCGGDIGVQVCANDPQVAFHAIRNLARIARGSAVIRWSQAGFQRTERAAAKPGTARNLMGFKDGTGNPDVNDDAAMNDVVWVQPSEGPAWMTNGSYMIVRRIRMRIEEWDRSTLQDQEATFGRARISGAPLGGTDEFEKLDLDKKDASGKPLIPVDSHVALAHGDGKVRILRRSYSYTNGIDAKTGQLDTGLFFVCFNRDPRKQFVPMQQRLAKNDRLNEYIVHVGSAVFACLPGASAGGFLGQELF